jgi:protein arginine kinase activator
VSGDGRGRQTAGGKSCDACGERPATIRYAEMVDGALSTWNLCEKCAREKGVTGSLSSFSTPLVNVLMGLLGEPEARRSEEPVPRCPRCGMTYEDFRRTGRLGCGGCYETFRDELTPLLRRIHGSTRHAGRVPSTHADDAVERSELRRLRGELSSAVRREEYERAAEIRDRIRRLEREVARAGGSDVDV